MPGITPVHFHRLRLLEGVGYWLSTSTAVLFPRRFPPPFLVLPVFHDDQEAIALYGSIGRPLNQKLLWQFVLGSLRPLQVVRGRGSNFSGCAIVLPSITIFSIKVGASAVGVFVSASTPCAVVMTEQVARPNCSQLRLSADGSLVVMPFSPYEPRPYPRPGNRIYIKNIYSY